MQPATKRHWLLALAIGLIIMMLALVIHDFWPEIQLLLHPSESHQQDLRTLINEHKWRDLLFLYVIITLMSAIPGLSNSVICIFVGLCYGPILGILINWFGNMSGNWVVAALINKIQLPAKWQDSPRLNKLRNAQHPALALTLGFMIPIIPSMIVNAACVEQNIPRPTYLLMVAAGVFPASVLYAIGGHALHKGALIEAGIYLAIIILLVLLSKRLESLIKARRSTN
ncbi:TVP38/TMEM64 family protein [Limosilactobacillus equigenerosi]|uniref:TVP38/TMEM64 family membrane protein n=1 Tax=Limosilactobacillus equigenerosi DSM 18793 = JCM 14505 TaxID=1423742 RepID=A0A0R1USW7_9LACO|nr:VTT domain-containing protein [Limosilactobacillus equigenerosi]KRL96288.1 SNARE associated Golgi family protein [Limosilactobacillus equigenerosi DSM 18793 = JCM 14505]